ncbi:MAG: hypothetical protein AAGF60_03700 [Pseudomonadota bacterium]
MMRLGLAVLCLAWAGAAAALDAERLSGAEQRYLQAALAYEGTYQGRIDGRWGRGSRGALAAVPAGQITPLLRRFEGVLSRGGWAVATGAGGQMSFLLPFAEMRNQGTSATGADQERRDGSLSVRSLQADAGTVRQLHEAARSTQAPGTDRLALDQPELRVTSVRQRDGRTLYLRSEDAVTGNWATTIVEWAPSAEAEARVIVASVRIGGQPMITLGTGALRAAHDGRQPRPAPPPVSDKGWDPWNDQPLPSAPARREGRAGIGFYINNTDFIVPRSAVQACGGRRVQVAGGGRARTLDVPMGPLVLMTSARRSAQWLSLSASGTEGSTGAAAQALAVAPDGWSAHRGRAVRTALLTDIPPIFTGGLPVADLPTGPGFRGAPLLDGRGHVFGVAVGPADVSRLPRILRPRSGGRLASVASTAGIGAALEARGILYTAAPPPAARYRMDPARALVSLDCAQG